MKKKNIQIITKIDLKKLSTKQLAEWYSMIGDEIVRRMK